MTNELTIPKGKSKNRSEKLREFADSLLKIQEKIDFKISSRGWCYQLEGYGLINKSEFDIVQKLINECRKEGYLPVNFTAEDISRDFDFVYTSETEPKDFLREYINIIEGASEEYKPSFFENQEYFIQVLVEKIDLKTLFSPICDQYRIPIATAKGWSDINQRAIMISRFRRAESQGKIPVLFYCGDFDPAGVKISDTLRKNINDLKKTTGWDSKNLIIDRFGLNYDFIIDNELSWINNLMTSGKKDLSNPKHQDFKKYNVGEWIKKYGAKKVEANAIITIPELARKLFFETLVNYIPEKEFENYDKMKKEGQREIDNLVSEKTFQKALKQLNKVIKGSENGSS